MYPLKLAVEIEKRYQYVSLISRLLTFVKNVILKGDTGHSNKRSVMTSSRADLETRRFGYEMCRDSIGGVWGEICEDGFRITPLSGGLTNYLYICSLADDTAVPDNQPRKVLLRVYGDIAKSSSFLVQNSVIFALMSEKGLGPKLYGMNSRGRIEEYIPTRCLETIELSDPGISDIIASKMAIFHALDMPLCKEPRFLFDTLDKWVKDADVCFKKSSNKKDLKFVNVFRSYGLNDELVSLKKILRSVPSPTVFSHNDLQEGNILYRPECSNPDQRLTMIDWEYCSYNYRGFDLGNHFMEWCLNYTVSEEPYFSYKPEYYPTRQQQYQFFSKYITTKGEEVSDSVLTDMYREANVFGLASHFMWGLWSILQNEMSTISFGFMEYAECRLSEYFRLKERLKQDGLIEY